MEFRLFIKNMNKNFIIYLCVINIITFLAFGQDPNGKRRMTNGELARRLFLGLHASVVLWEHGSECMYSIIRQERTSSGMGFRRFLQCR